MAKKSGKFERPLGARRYRKLFVIATEGAKTEPEYFRLFNSRQATVHVHILKGRHKNSPPQVLRRMDDHIKQKELKSTDEAWLVVDKDHWTDGQLKQLHTWTRQQKNYGFALSNPKFEYWLLLHFEDGDNINSSRDCDIRLKSFFPDYKRGIDRRRITSQRIKDAVRRAKLRDSPPCSDWPRTIGCTTVYRLVESIQQQA